MDLEIIPTPNKPYINDERINSFYKDLVSSFLWVNNPQGETRIKQCIDNITTSVYQAGEMKARNELSKTLAKQRQKITELEEKYEPKQKNQDRGYKANKYSGD